MDSQLFLEKHVAKVFPQIHLVCQLYSFLDGKAFQMTTHALVISWVDFRNVLYMRLPLKIIKKPHIVQNVIEWQIVVYLCNTTAL